ncbi:MAG: hypothetical protein ABIN17_00235 [candidate division WOR-3 bacterium]
MINFLFFNLLISANQESLRTKRGDYFFSQDKFKHFYFNLLLTNFLYFESYYSLKLEKEKALYISTSIPLTASIGKEIWDKKKKKLFSFKDLIWDIMGIALSIYIIYPGFK